MPAAGSSTQRCRRATPSAAAAAAGLAAPPSRPHIATVSAGGVPAAVQHDPAALVGVRAADVEDVARLDREPAHRAGAVQLHHADPGRVAVVPGVGQPAAEQADLEGDRQVEEHRVPVGDREVVHHRRPGARDLDAAHQLARGREPVVGQVRRERVVAEEVQVAGHRVALGVGGHRGAQPAAEVARPDGVQLRGQLVREPALDQREQPAGVLEHVRVGHHRGPVQRAVGADERAAGQRAGAHPAVAVPLGAAVPQPHAVDHAVPGEPVPRVLAGPRVGAVAQVAPGQLGRQQAVDGQVDGVDLVGDRGQVAGQVERRVGGGHGEEDGPAVTTCQVRHVKIDL